MNLALWVNIREVVFSYIWKLKHLKLVLKENFNLSSPLSYILLLCSSMDHTNRKNHLVDKNPHLIITFPSNSGSRAVHFLVYLWITHSAQEGCGWWEKSRSRTAFRWGFLWRVCVSGTQKSPSTYRNQVVIRGGRGNIKSGRD